MLGLQRCHVDMEALTIKVEQEWVVPPGKRPILKAPKTVAGYRTIEARGSTVAVEQLSRDSAGNRCLNELQPSSVHLGTGPWSFPESKSSTFRPNASYMPLQHSPARRSPVALSSWA